MYNHFVDKILNINKPSGMTSFDVVAIIRKRLGVKKVGHCGTLDPMAKGVLVVLVGDATKKQNDFLKQDKEYIAKIAFGFCTDTFDLEGTVNQLENPPKISASAINLALQSFTGEIYQKVPMYSAVKVRGKKLYDLARKGIDLGMETPVRKVTVYSIELLSFENERIEKLEKVFPVLTIRVVCGSGTYIRSLANDIGHALGTCATLIDLVRTRVGEFEIKDSIVLESIVKDQSA